MCRPNSSNLKMQSKWCFLWEYDISGRETLPTCWKKCQHHKDCAVDTGRDPVVPTGQFLRRVIISYMAF